MKWLLTVVFAACAGVAGYVAWLLWRDQDNGKWFFSVFALFFLALVTAPYLPRRKPKPESTSTRFVPHWFMMLAILVVLATLGLSIIGAFLRH
ncbi:MAG: hypothetical protein ACHQ5A_07005 [Opitutales bacterium]